MKILKIITFCLIHLVIDGFIYPTDDFPPLSLSGVLLANNSDSSVAAIKNEKTGKTAILKVGDRILDMQLSQVFQDGIILKKGDQIFWLLLDRAAQSKAGNLSKQNPVSEKKDVADNQIPQREYARSEIQKRMEQERALIIKETKVVPRFVDGKIDGFKVIGLPQKGIASEVGIQKDDVIKEINGVKLNNLTALVTMYKNFSEEERYEVLIERDKKLIRQVYVLK